MRRVGLFLFFGLSAFGQTSPVPYLDFYGPSFENNIALESFPGAFASIRNVDFKNFDSLKNGHLNGPGNNTLDLEAVHYLTARPESGGGAALVLYEWFNVGGSSSSGGSAVVFTVSGGHLQSVQRVEWDTHFQAGQPTDSFDPVTTTFVVRTAHYIPGDAHCCVSAMDVVTLKWDGAHFLQTDLRTELSQYGREHGTVLPQNPVNGSPAH